MSSIKWRNGRAAEERLTMQLSENSGDLVVAAVDLANPVRRRQDLRHRLARSISFDENPLARALASAAGSPYCATARLTTQQGMASAGDEASRVSNSQAT
jgi:hypothetical protein